MMNKRKIYKLTKNDDRAIQLFVKLGMPKNLAKTLMYISLVSKCYSTDIEQGANLRQPEVNIAVNELSKKGWVSKQILHQREKGRPAHVYKPTVPLSQIVKTFEREKLEEIEQVKRGVSELKTIFPLK